MISLDDKSVVIVGAKRVGQVLAKRFANEGMRIAIAYRHSKIDAQNLLDEVIKTSPDSFILQVDITSEDSVKNMIKEVEAKFGELNFAVNLASQYNYTPFESLDSSTWDENMADAKGSFLFAINVAEMMKNNLAPTKGHIMFFTDWAAGNTPYVGYLPYLTSKAAIDFMTRCLAVELASHGILVNSIAPGPTERPPEIDKQTWTSGVIEKSPLRRESSAEEMAELIISLLKSETITGETIRVDSGRHLAGPGID